MKKKNIAFAIITALGWLLVYTAFAFVLNEANPSLWDTTDRIGMVIFCLSTIVLTPIFLAEF